MIGDWLLGNLTDFFIGIIDFIAYSLLQIAYNIFYATTRLNLFSGPGEELFGLITKRLYMALSIVMVFFFAYQLILMIIDPEGNAAKSATEMVKKTIISIIAIILMPLLFKYMAIFQDHVITNGTIEAFILGTNGANTGNAGKNVAMMTLISFYHPAGTDYSTYFDENGELRIDYTYDESKNIWDNLSQMKNAMNSSDAYNECVNLVQEQIDEGEAKKGKDNGTICSGYIAALVQWKYRKNATVATLTSVKELRKSVGKNMYYSWVVSTLAAIAMAYFFVVYSIDIAVRAVKLGFLQIVSPIPLICNIFKQTEKTFQSWKKQLLNSYLELFLRLFVIFFALELVKLIPTFLAIIFNSISETGASILTKCILLVLLILGIFKFAKDVPNLIKDLFGGGDLFKGLNLKPGIKKRIEDNDLYQRTKTGFVEGGASAVSRFKTNWDKNKGASIGKQLTGSLAAGVRGLYTGGVHGIKNPNKGIGPKAFMEMVDEGAKKGTSLEQNYKTVGQKAHKYFADFIDTSKSAGTALAGKSTDYNALNSNIASVNNVLKIFEDLVGGDSKVKAADKELTELKNKLGKVDADYAAKISEKEAEFATKIAEQNAIMNDSTRTNAEQSAAAFEKARLEGELVAVKNQLNDALARTKAQLKNDIDTHKATLAQTKADAANASFEAVNQISSNLQKAMANLGLSQQQMTDLNNEMIKRGYSSTTEFLNHAATAKKGEITQGDINALNDIKDFLEKAGREASAFAKAEQSGKDSDKK